MKNLYQLINIFRDEGILCKKDISIFYIRLIPQGTVDNNLMPDRFAGPKALDPYYCRQPTYLLHDLCLEVLTVNGTEWGLFVTKAFPPTHILLM